MDKLVIHLALHGVLVLTVSIVGGWFLYRAIVNQRKEHAWHLLHAGGTSRGILLLALAATIHLPALPFWQVATIAWLIIFFVWTSTLAMLIAAASGDRGLGLSGSIANRLVYILYAVGTVAIFPACAWLAFGLFKAL
jgi:multisubunit Na+/H+ antiporter MnhG subunit